VKVEVFEHSQVQWGRTTIPYAIRRSGRRGTVAVAVEPTGEVLLTAPASTPVERLDRVVADKARWIVARRRKVQALALPPLRREFVSGETFHYLGRQHRLLVRSGKARVRLHRGRIEVQVPDGPGRAERVRALLVGWYRAQAERRLPDRVERWSKKVGVIAPRTLVRQQQKRWGSCDASGTLRFNWRVIQAQLSLVDYVVVHELVHLRHRHHTSAYWASLGTVMPDYERRRSLLRGVGGSAAW
jgi:predicted metal-dependent hydrolase